MRRRIVAALLAALRDRHPQQHDCVRRPVHSLLRSAMRCELPYLLRHSEGNARLAAAVAHPVRPGNPLPAPVRHLAPLRLLHLRELIE